MNLTLTLCKFIKKCTKQSELDDLGISGKECTDAEIHGKNAHICFCQDDGCNGSRLTGGKPNYSVNYLFVFVVIMKFI